MNKVGLITITGLVLLMAGLSACDSDDGSESGDASGTGGGAATTNTTTTTTTTDTSGYDTSISTGEFSFFAVSLDFILSKSPGACTSSNVSSACLGGLGGNLGGLAGADALCAAAAQGANPGDTHLWRAFLSTSTENAIGRVGTGPWYSAPPKEQSKSSYASEGLLVGNSTGDLLQQRPGDTETIVYVGVNQSQGAGNESSWPFSQCLLNEFGYCTQEDGDTHDTLTGSTTSGTYAGSLSSTCQDWTSTSNSDAPAFGHSWPRQLNSTDDASDWINTGEMGEIGCAAIINVGTTNYMSGGGGPMGGGSSSTYGGGVGSAGGYGAFYCFAYSGA